MWADNIRNTVLAVTTVLALLATVLQITTSYLWDRQSEDYVMMISGEQSSGIYELHGSHYVNIKWDTMPLPHRCPVFLGFIWVSPSGVVYTENEGLLLTADEHAIALRARLSGPSPEIISPEIYEAMKREPGDWKYKISFSFHCSVLKGNALVDVVNFDDTYFAKPVIINTEDYNEE